MMRFILLWWRMESPSRGRSIGLSRILRTFRTESSVTSFRIPRGVGVPPIHAGTPFARDVVWPTPFTRYVHKAPVHRYTSWPEEALDLGVKENWICSVTRYGEAIKTIWRIRGVLQHPKKVHDGGKGNKKWREYIVSGWNDTSVMMSF